MKRKKYRALCVTIRDNSGVLGM